MSIFFLKIWHNAEYGGKDKDFIRMIVYL
jgi:hypothetical protein